MFGPDYTAGCPACSAVADGFNGFVVHLANHDVMLWAVSRAPLASCRRIAADGVDVSLGVLVRQRLQLRLQRLVHRGTAARGGRRIQPRASGGAARGFREAARGPEVRGHVRNRRPCTRERPGMSAFAEDGVVYHTYSAYARTGRPWGMYQWLDRAPRPQRDGRLVAPPRYTRAERCRDALGDWRSHDAWLLIESSSMSAGSSLQNLDLVIV